MLSETARMTSSTEARFRVQAPNSSCRDIKVIALDTPSEGLLSRLAERPWNHAEFLAAATFVPARDDKHCVPMDQWLTDLSGRPKNLLTEVNAADLVVMVAKPDGNVHAATVIGEICREMRVNSAAFIYDAQFSSDEAISKTLAQLRPWSLMVVIAESEDAIEDMLIALRA